MSCMGIRTSLAAKAMALLLAAALIFSSIALVVPAFADESAQGKATVTATSDEQTTEATDEEVTIEDEETPLANAKSCKIHYFIAVGMILTVIYAGMVIARRHVHTKDISGTNGGSGSFKREKETASETATEKAAGVVWSTLSSETAPSTGEGGRS